MMDNEWQSLCDAIAQFGTRLLETAPDEDTRVEGLAYLARITAYGVEQTYMRGERTIDGIQYVPARVGGANPDYRIGVARIRGDQRYRLSGRINQCYRIGVGLYTAHADGGIDVDDYKVIRQGSPDLSPDGRFAIEVGADSAAGLKPAPSTNIMQIRQILLDRDGRHADLALESEKVEVPDPDFSVDRARRDFAALRHAILGLPSQFLEWSSWFARLPNQIEPLRPEFDAKVRGEPGTRYWTGYFRLEPGQALLVEIPAMTADYWGLMLANHWQEPLIGSALNHHTARRDADGITRIIISASDPGTPNWLPTRGRSRGVIWHRRMGASSSDTPGCTLQGTTRPPV